jgi:predicted alpha/beta-hydrolase family hydrolase
MTTVEELRIPLNAADSVSALWLAPADARAALVLAHGAGAGMRHRSMAAIAGGLAERGIATLRYQFPYMEHGSKRPDPPHVAHAAVRAAVNAAQERAPNLPLFAGGRSFGGRMTSQAQAAQPLTDVRGLVFFAFPLHPAGKPGVSRADHLGEVKIPMLFLQGTRDALAELLLLEPTVSSLAPHATLILADEADHSFHVPRKTGRTDSDALSEVLDAGANWMLSR